MENSHRFFENRACRYFPCHEEMEECNCLFCYCPLYHYDKCPGNPVYLDVDGRKLKDCTECTYPHRPKHYDVILKILAESPESLKKRESYR